jgi:hypothetical protein
MKTCTLLFLAFLPAAIGVAPAPVTQDEAALRELVGARVTVLMDMPATQKGINYYPLRGDKIDYDENSDRVAEFGVSIPADETATITAINVKGKHIEFQLDGGGYGTFGDFEPSRPNVPYPSKSRREEELEQELRDETDVNEKRRIERRLDDLRDARERDYRRDRERAEDQYDRDVERVADARLRKGSRINVRFDSSVPTQAQTTGGLQAMLGELIRFTNEVEATVQYGDGGMRGDAPTAKDGGPWRSPLSKGMSQYDVNERLGSPVGCVDDASGTLTAVTCTYDLGDATAEIIFVSNALVRWTIASR